MANVLYVTKEQLEGDIDQLHRNIDANNVYMQELEIARENDHKAYEARLIEHEDALDAIDESIGLLNTLNGGVSLAQVKSARASINQLIRKVPKYTEGAFAKALLSLASGEFADGGSLDRVRDMLNDIRANIVESQNTEHSDEEKSVELYEAEKAAKLQENKDFEITIVTKTGELEAVAKKIAQNERFLAGRKVDLTNFHAEYDSEEAAYVKDTEIYNQLMKELAAETETAETALNVVESGEFAGYLGERMNSLWVAWLNAYF